MAKNKKSLIKAKIEKNDEFYTQYLDIEREINAYLDYDPDVFKDKTILLPCDDPEWSNFTKYFAQNFETFGLKELISTSYAIESKNYDMPYQLTLFETKSPHSDVNKTRIKGKIFTLTKDTNKNGKIDIDDLEWNYLEGDGDFRSDEVTALRDEADFIITNPPFSLFREFLAWIVEADKKFVIIGNMNAITYKEVFPLIKDNKMWLGRGFNSGSAMFYSPMKSEFSGNSYDKKTGLVKFGNTNWYTNIDHGRRHEKLRLMNIKDNIKFNKALKGLMYQKYDNYDAIEVPVVKAIPSDYDGVMGVPISFLDKYNPDQFKIMGLTTGRDKFESMPIKRYINPKQFNPNGTISNGSKVNNSSSLLHKEKPKGIYYTADNSDGYLTITYARILIKHKEGNNEN